MATRFETLNDKEFLTLKREFAEESNRRRVGPSCLDLKINLKGDGPFVVVPLGDLHAGSGSTKWKEVLEFVRRIVATPNVYVVGIGDWIESVKTEHGVDSIQSALPIDEQMKLIRGDVIGPLHAKGRLLAIVSGHVAHEGFLANSIGADFWSMMVDGYGVPRIANGGLLNLEVVGKSENRLLRIQVFHNTPGGGGGNALTPMEKIAFQWSGRNAPDLILAGHNHKSAVGITRDTTMIRCGTPKGNIDNPDPYGISLGMNGTDPMGQSAVIWPDEKGRERDFTVWPSINQKTGWVVQSAMELFNKLTSQRMDVEVSSEIGSREGGGSNAHVFIRQDSVASGTDALSYGVTEFDPIYGKVAWNISSMLPIGVMMISNLRVGSRVHDENQQAFVKEMLGKPYVYSILGRQAVDRKVPGLDDRIVYLESMLNLIAPLDGKSRYLAVLYDAIFKSPLWRKTWTVKRSNEEGEDSFVEPLMAVTETAKRLDTVVVEHMGTVEIGLSGTKQTIAVLDTLENRGSTASPTAGLKSVYDFRMHKRPSVVMGGHMPRAGVSQHYHLQNDENNYPIMIAPGWGASRANWRPGLNAVESDADPLGPGVIMIPMEAGKSAITIPVGREEQWILLEALRLHAAAKLGWIDKDRLTKRKKRK